MTVVNDLKIIKLSVRRNLHLILPYNQGTRVHIDILSVQTSLIRLQQL